MDFRFSILILVLVLVTKAKAQERFLLFWWAVYAPMGVLYDPTDTLFLYTGKMSSYLPG
jgi:hypothetical protein